MRDIKKVVLAYSGGLDTSVILRWIKEAYGAEVVAYTADVGQGEEVAEAEEKALATGASVAIVDDLRAEFVVSPSAPITIPASISRREPSRPSITAPRTRPPASRIRSTSRGP